MPNSNLSLIERCKAIGSLLKHSTLGLYLCESSIDNSPLNILVADDGKTLSYVRGLLSQADTGVSRKGTVSVFKAHDLIHHKVDLIVVGVHRMMVNRYAECGFRIVPKWVRLLVPVREEPYSRLYNQGRQTRKYFKWMLKKVEKAGFECEFIKDPARFDLFYHEMYKPYALHRFGQEAMLYTYSDVKSAFEKGALALVSKDGVPLAGTVSYPKGAFLKLPYTGIAVDKIDLARDGAAFALDSYLIQLAHSQGYTYLDLGFSRAFLSDGSLKYKLNWHPEVVPDYGKGVFAVAAPDLTPQAERFLQENPHYHVTPEGCALSHKGSADQ